MGNINPYFTSHSCSSSRVEQGEHLQVADRSVAGEYRVTGYRLAVVCVQVKSCDMFGVVPEHHTYIQTLTQLHAPDDG